MTAAHPLAAPRRNRPALRRLARRLLRAAGWRIVSEPPELPKFVAIVAPHTSNWDFFVGLGTMYGLDLEVRWLGKHTIFRGPVGRLLRRLGGRPVRRHTPEGVVAEAAAAIRAEPQFILALAPEGTRSRVDHWRTGFYRIAEASGVPIVPVWFDWSRHEIGLGTPLVPTGDMDADLAALQAVYRPEMARHPELFWGAT
jgi:1-acyl-sn-glycerol-3-phosphate acyltransferase